jgi:hypothetical protein
VTLDGRATLHVAEDGRPRPGSLVHVADRVGALGGESEFGPNDLRVEISCE